MREVVPPITGSKGLVPGMESTTLDYKLPFKLTKHLIGE